MQQDYPVNPQCAARLRTRSCLAVSSINGHSTCSPSSYMFCRLEQLVTAMTLPQQSPRRSLMNIDPVKFIL